MGRSQTQLGGQTEAGMGTGTPTPPTPLCPSPQSCHIEEGDEEEKEEEKEEEDPEDSFEVGGGPTMGWGSLCPTAPPPDPTVPP